jgi:hypothetical protein
MQKKYAIIAVAVMIVLTVAVVFGMKGKSKDSTAQTQQVLETGETIKDVDSSVEVSLTPQKAGHEVLIAVKNPPSGTKTMEYQITYNEKTKGPQGAIGEIDPDKLTADVTLGTCSSGTCVYHQVDGNVDLLITFEGSYGKQKFEKSYSITK